jgi:predicted ATPase
MLGALEGFMGSLTRAHLKRHLEGCAWLVRLMPELAEQALVSLPEWTLAPEQERRLMFAAVGRFLANVAGPSGVLLTLDDLQWAGADALDLLSSLARSDPERPLRILGAYRSTEAPAGAPLAEALADLAREELVTLVDVPPLEPAEAAELLDVALRSVVGANAAEPDAELVERVLRRTGGIPFFLLSCARGLPGEQPRLTPDERAPDTVPWEVAHTIRQRIAALPPCSQELLCLAAIVDRSIPGALLAQVTRWPEDELLLALAAASHAGLLVEETDDLYRFAHDLIREVVEADLHGRQRKTLHRRVAEALERHSGGLAVEQLAYHYVRAGELERAIRYLEQSGDRAWDMHANIEAQERYAQLVEAQDQLGRIAETARACEKLAVVLISCGEYDNALEALERAARIHQAVGDLESLAKVMGQIGRAHARKGTSEEGVAGLKSFLELPFTEALSPRGQAIIYAGLAQLYQASGDYVDQLKVAERAAKLAYVAGDRAILAEVEVRRGTALCMLGRAHEGLEALEGAVPLAEAVGDLRSLSSALNGLAEGYLIRGDLRRHKRYVDRACEVAERLGDPALLAFMWLNRGDNAYYTGAWSVARSNYEQAMTALAQIKASWYYTYALLDRGMLSQAEGDREAASADLEEAIALASHGVDLQALRWALCIVAERALLEGDGQLIKERLTLLVERAGHEEREVVLVLALLAWAALEVGDEAYAQACVIRSIEKANSAHDRLLLVDAKRIQAIIFVRQRLWPAAERTLVEAISLSQAMLYPYAEAKALYVYGLLHAQLGEQKQARERLEAASAICGRLGERLYAEHIERALATLKC